MNPKCKICKRQRIRNTPKSFEFQLKDCQKPFKNIHTKYDKINCGDCLYLYTKQTSASNTENCSIDTDNQNEDDYSAEQESQGVSAYVTKTYGDNLSDKEVDDEINQCIKLAKCELKKELIFLKRKPKK